ncbi:probable fatty acid-binding protein [Bactrocera neohumeralis]|uniref:probable fatty acid-binding protein n=1 Tax=Bactrocera tryoni TaxID=59916 RepID=UPI001A99AADD|nr:probable fatty acid-binding protein [Bactrocera tryoni]XP_039967198.1 probable fatty acid-binding protein [Bactrocera tryoni]XP_050335055.1 probable fatty acid-binding protein [Bactrocera neohumeralis]XP_050335056.1 probable fatty acid-binding protein [Bactrocera neohumeralis]XP_050335057.1 probable fatty acid-binding protein [Bactrocera neohumeralis]
MLKKKSLNDEEINNQNSRNRRKTSLSLPYEPVAKWEGKIYKLVDGTNFDQYMAALGVGPVLRKIGNSVRPVIALRKNGIYYSLITASDFTTTIQRFELCVPFDEFTLDGRQMRTTFSLYNNVLIQHQMGNIPSTIVREFHEDKMIAKYMVKDVEAVRVFQAADEEMCRLIWEANVAKRYQI